MGVNQCHLLSNYQHRLYRFNLVQGIDVEPSHLGIWKVFSVDTEKNWVVIDSLP